MNLLDRLPQVLLVDILSNYCTVGDLGKVDTACCSHHWRKDFLSLLDFATNNNMGFHVHTSARSSFPHASYRYFNNYIEWKAKRRVKTQGVLSVVHCEGSCYSSHESVREEFYNTHQDSHWHQTTSMATISANLCTENNRFKVDSIRFIRAKEGNESGHGYYNGRNPMHVILSFQTQNVSDCDVTTQSVAIPWGDDANHIAELSIPEYMQEMLLPHEGHISSIKLRLSNRYPDCNTPPGHQHAYNGDKLSLQGLEFIGTDI